MSVTATPRKLAAILHADVAGYSRLMGADEETTIRLLTDYRTAMAGCIKHHAGHVVDTAGDSLLAEFSSVVAATDCALELQQMLKSRNADLPADRRLEFRMGIELGDVLHKGNAVYGDGVNVAARIQALAEPGDVCVSDAVRRAVANRLPVTFAPLGERAVKNITEPVKAFRVTPQEGWVPSHFAPGPVKINVPFAVGTILIAAVALLAVWLSTQQDDIKVTDPATGATSASTKTPTSVTEKPSIAVLPFDNVSQDPEQEYFVDGISEDIITDFSRLSNLTVIAWSTTSNYKGKSVPPQQVRKELGVSYVLGGSVRKSGDKLRITAQLVDTANSKQLWAERYDRKLADVFALQDDVTKKIVATLAVRLTAAEKAKLGRSGTNNFDAYDTFLRGQQLSRQRTKESNARAREAYRRAIELDPTYSRPYGALAVTRTRDLRRGWTDLNSEEALARALDLAQKSVALDPSSPQAYWALGFVYLFRKQYDEAATAAKQAVTLAPNFADGYGLLAFINNFLGNAEDALGYARKGMTLNPNYTYELPWNLGLAYHTLGRYREAAEALREALAHNENAQFPRLYLASCYVRLGRLEDAKWEVEQVTTQDPHVSVSQYADTLPMKDQRRVIALLDDLRKAGMPD